jgi:hypothetical protein
MARMPAITCTAVTGLIFSIPAFAIDFKYDNQFCFVSTANHVIQHAEGFSSGTFDTTGIRMGPEGDPFRAMAEHCVGQFTIINGEQEDHVGCEAANSAGDKIFGLATRKFSPLNPQQGEGDFRIVHGTGKFAGIVGEGKSKVTDVILQNSTQTIACAHSWGTYTIK